MILPVVLMPLGLIMSVQSWGAFEYLRPPAGCDYEPQVPYIVKLVPPGRLGGTAESVPGKRLCKIFLEPHADQAYQDALLRHEKGHCNCPRWVH